MLMRNIISLSVINQTDLIISTNVLEIYYRYIIQHLQSLKKSGLRVCCEEELETL